MLREPAYRTGRVHRCLRRPAPPPKGTGTRPGIAQGEKGRKTRKPSPTCYTAVMRSGKRSPKAQNDFGSSNGKGNIIYTMQPVPIRKVGAGS